MLGKSRVFLFPAFFPSADFYERFNFRFLTLQDSGFFPLFFLEIYAEIEARPARIDPLAHAQRLTAVFYV